MHCVIHCVSKIFYDVMATQSYWCVVAGKMMYSLPKVELCDLHECMSEHNLLINDVHSRGGVTWQVVLHLRVLWELSPGCWYWPPTTHFGTWYQLSVQGNIVYNFSAKSNPETTQFNFYTIPINPNKNIHVFLICNWFIHNQYWDAPIIW